MTGDVDKTIELLGCELDVVAEFDVSLVDNGIGPYEFWGFKGVHHDWGWEVQDVTGLRFDFGMERYAEDYLKSWGVHPLERCLPIFIKKLEAALAKLNPRDIFTDDEVIEAAANQAAD